ncbi:MAG: DUF6449 domain-containing protein [Clostridiales bacterium]|nr:DUF6449 domain-containing protein [Clostridiales bacterium]
MTSRRLYFKLMREDLKSRLWAFAQPCLGFFFLFPVGAAFLAGEIREYANYQTGLLRYQKELAMLLGFDNGVTVFLMIVAALICGLSSFSFLNSRSKVDFYHSLPVRREIFFLVNYIDGILILMIPYAVCLALGVILGIANGGVAGTVIPLAVRSFGLEMTYFVLMYTVVVVAAMLTGHLVVGFLGCLVLAFLVPIAVGVLQGYFDTFFYSYLSGWGDEFFEMGIRISPVTEYIMRVASYGSGEGMTMAVCVAWGVSVILAVCACLLYRIRPSEAAGKAMVFGVSRPLVRIPVVIVSGLGLGLLFWSIRESTGWAVFGVICGSVIAHCVMEMIYHFDLKKLFSCKGQLAGCILAGVAVLLVFRYDAFGYDTWTPKEEELASAAVYFGSMSDWTDYGEIVMEEDGYYNWISADNFSWVFDRMAYTDTENILGIAEAGIAKLQEQKERTVLREDEAGYTWGYENAGEIDAEYPDGNYYIYVCFHLTNGRKVYRQYIISLNGLEERLDRMITDRQYREGVYPLMNLHAEEVAGIHFRTTRNDETKLLGLKEEEKKALLEAYQREFSTLTFEEMYTKAPIGLIRFTTGEEEEAVQWYERQEELKFRDYSNRYPNYRLTDMQYYPVYESFAETIRLLEAQQINTDFYEKADISGITVNWYDNSTQVNHSERITDDREVEQILAVLAVPGLQYYNQFYRYSDVSADISIDEGKSVSNYTISFPRGQVPESILERLRENR